MQHLVIVMLQTAVIGLSLCVVDTVNIMNDSTGGGISLKTCVDTLAYGRCPTVEPLKDLNVSGIYGLWYMAADYNTDPRFRDQNCITRLFSNHNGERDGKAGDDEVKDQGCRIDILEGWIDDVTGEHHQMDSWIVSPDVNDKMHMVHTMAMGAPMRWYPLATDYDTYMVTFACAEFPPDCPVVHRTYASIFTRRAEFSEDQFTEKLNEIYAKFGIDVDRFRYFDNTDCELTAADSSREVAP